MSTPSSAVNASPSGTVPGSWTMVSARPSPATRADRETRGTCDSATHGQRPSGDTASPLVKRGRSRANVVAESSAAGPDVDELSDVDLSYTPPFSAPWDPVQSAAQSWLAAA